jgi:hypothetical protein
LFPEPLVAVALTPISLRTEVFEIRYQPYRSPTIDQREWGYESPGFDELVNPLFRNTNHFGGAGGANQAVRWREQFLYEDIENQSTEISSSRLFELRYGDRQPFDRPGQVSHPRDLVG